MGTHKGSDTAGLSLQAVLLEKALLWHNDYPAQGLTMDHPHQAVRMLLSTSKPKSLLLALASIISIAST